MKPGAIALARIQQADSRLKVRPVLLLNSVPPFSDFLVCGLSSKLHHEAVGFDEVIASSDDDFSQSGLKAASLIRLGMLATIPKSVLLGKLGTVSESRLQRLRSRLADHIQSER